MSKITVVQGFHTFAISFALIRLWVGYLFKPPDFNYFQYSNG